MKYMLLIYDNPTTREQFLGDAALMAELDAVMQEITDSGELVGGGGALPPAQQVLDLRPAVHISVPEPAISGRTSRGSSGRSASARAPSSCAPGRRAPRRRGRSRRSGFDMRGRQATP